MEKFIVPFISGVFILFVFSAFLSIKKPQSQYNADSSGEYIIFYTGGNLTGNVSYKIDEISNMEVVRKIERELTERHGTNCVVTNIQRFPL